MALTAGAWSLAGAASAQVLAQGPEQHVSIGRVIAALLLCLALAVAGALVMRARMDGRFAGWSLRIASPAATKRLALVDRLRLSPQLEICMVRCDQRELVLAVTQSGATVLHETAAPVSEPAP